MSLGRSTWLRGSLGDRGGREEQMLEGENEAGREAEMGGKKGGAARTPCFLRFFIFVLQVFC